MNAFERASLYGVMPVIAIPDPSYAKPLGDALRDGGIPQIEVLMRNDAALESLRVLKAECPEVMAGAGTVLTMQQLEDAIEAGADFIVTPGFNPAIVERALERGVPILPGCVTASEVERGMSYGLNTFKFFPSEKMGGLGTIKELCGPYKGIKFVPTSGLTLENMASYLAYDGIAAVGGSFVAPKAILEARDFDTITALCRRAMRSSLGFTLAHVGVNGKDEDEGIAIARRFAMLFDLPVADNPKSAFAGAMVEASKGTLPGTHGHIGVGTLNVRRAMHFLESRGVEFREDYRSYDKAGNLMAAYIREEIGGFAVHIVKRA